MKPFALNLPFLKTPTATALLPTGASALVFIGVSALFFALLGHEPFGLLWQVVLGAFGDKYSFTETLVKTAPILLCALAAAVPARLGLLTVGASGQFYLGAWLGTGIVLLLAETSGLVLLPLMLLGAALGGAAWSVIPGFLRARWEVNETLSTLLLNYVGALIVEWAVYGPWRDPGALGFPATRVLPDSIKLPTFLESRAHLGLLFGLVLAVGLHLLFTRSRWGLSLRIMKSNRKVAESAGMNYKLNVILIMAIGGAIAGLAGMCEVSAIHGRLQPGIALNFGLTGFLVAWMAGQHLIKIIPLSLIMGAILAASDALQLFYSLPAAIAVVLQALLFLSVLAVGGFLSKRKKA